MTTRLFAFAALWTASAWALRATPIKTFDAADPWLSSVGFASAGAYVYRYSPTEGVSRRDDIEL